MIVRERVDGDLDGCVDALAQVHECDGYPNTWPEHPRRWLSSPTVVKAWVGESDGRVVGHVAVDSEVAGAPRTAGSIAVSRLFVHPGSRGNGLSDALLDAVTDFAAESRLELVLDVVGRRSAGDRTVRASRVGVRRREARRLDPDRRRPARGTPIPTAALTTSARRAKLLERLDFPSRWCWGCRRVERTLSRRNRGAPRR